MKAPLDDLLRDPRAHGAEVDGADVRRWSERALAEWKRDAPEAAPARPRIRWQELGLFAAAAIAAAVLAPILAPTLVRLRDAISSNALSGPLSQVAETPYLWAAGGAALLVLTVPALRELTARLILE